MNFHFNTMVQGYRPAMQHLIFNHEIWEQCSGCGNYFDLRSFTYCPDCLTPSKKFKS